MGDPKISVVIPVRNGGETLRACLDSVLCQTFPPLEVIVIDDGSIDSTRAILDEYADCLKVFEGNASGAGPARNLGVSHARGDYIAFLDADDIWDAQKLEKQFSLLGGNAVVGAYAKYIAGEPGVFLGSSVRTATDSEATKMVYDAQGLPALLSTWVLPKSAFLASGGFDPNYILAQDFELAVRLARSGTQFRVVREPIVTYRIHSESETASNYIGQYLTAEYVKRKLGDARPISLEEWFASSRFMNSSRRKAWSGHFFRRGLVAIGHRRRLAAVLYLMIATVLGPGQTLTKVARQSGIGWKK